MLQGKKMGIIRQQFGRINHFLLLLVFLLGVNILFNLKYNWGGVAAITRSYIFVLAFYFVFIFSQLEYDNLIDEYSAKYGRFAKYKLFFDIRLFPFIFAILLNIAFLIINSSRGTFSISKPVLYVLDGRNSNMIFYSLILFFILRQNRRPGIAIPVFITGALVFFLADRFIYEVVPSGRGIGFVKLLKYMVFIFILSYDFARSRYRLIKLACVSVAGGIVLFMSVAAVYYGIYLYAGETSQSGSRSLRMLLKAGFISQLPRLEHQAGMTRNYEDISDLVYYAKRYDYTINFTPSEWDNVLSSLRMKTADEVFEYLDSRKTQLDFNLLAEYAKRQSAGEQGRFLASESFKRYFSGYFSGNSSEFVTMFETGNRAMKLWIIDCLAYADNPDSITFLIRLLTNVDLDISRHAYSALKNITDTDPAADSGKDICDLDVVKSFTRYRDERIRQKR